jgi:hypothetical protein
VIERGQRRRLRERRLEREELLLDLGAIVYELHRQGKRAPELLQRKASQLGVVDNEVRELEAALGEAPAQPEPEYEPATEEADVADLEAELAEAEQSGQPAEVHDLEDDEEPAVAEHEEPRA